jgi:NAD(P)-dependent dehydrogenase (short-subunit alcohol dehydrogenase family)
MGNLNGKTAWITGGGAGIGLAGAVELAKAGATIVISDCDGPALETALSRVKDFGPCEPLLLDVTDSKAVMAAAADMEKRYGAIDILVHSAGTNIPDRHFETMSIEGWDKLIAVDLSGMFYCCYAVLPGMRTRKDGTIINISSWAGRYAAAFTGPAYNSAKRAVIALTETINIEQCKYGIRATVILPEEVNTQLVDKRPIVPPQEARARMLQPEDLGVTIAFVAQLPPRVCVNELIISPTFNRSYLGGLNVTAT